MSALNTTGRWVVCGVLAVAGSAGAQTTWNGAVNSNWSVAGNWSSGIPNAQAGTLNIAGSSTVDVDFNNARTITIGGGHTVNQTSRLTATSGGHIYIGTGAGDGTLINTGTARTDSTGNSIRAGQVAGSTGTLTIRNNNTNHGTGGWTIIGEAGNGIFNFNDTGSTSGEYTSGGDIRMAANGGSTGILNIGAGTMRAASGRVWYVGETGNATVNISGGRMYAPTDYRIGNDNGANGTVNLSGTGELLIGSSSADLIIGASGQGTLFQTGGDVTTAFNYVTIGQEASGDGTYTMSGGTLDATNAEQFGVGVRGHGTFNISGNAFADIERLNVDRDNAVTAAGTVNQTGGIITTGDVHIGQNGEYHLDGGVLRTNAMNVNASGLFDWGAGTLTVRSNGAEGLTDTWTSAGFKEVRVGTEIDVVGSLSSGGNDSTLDLGSLFINSGTRFNRMTLTGTLDLSGTDDVLNFSVNPYELRANIGTVIETGELVLVDAASLISTFDEFTGVVNDAIGWTEYTGTWTIGSSDADDLPVNSWFLEQNTTTGDITFFYKVEGSVPEPGTMGLLALGIFVVRRVRNLKGDSRGVLGNGGSPAAADPVSFYD